MSFDPRSLERLKQLGRQLPQELPTPKPDTNTPAKATQRRHRVETEQDPQALFHELMQVSQDGTVPEHLLARLRDAEQRQENVRRERRHSESVDLAQGTGTALPPPPASPKGRGKNTAPRRPSVPAGSEEDSLYVAFGQLLLEDDDDDSA